MIEIELKARVEDPEAAARRARAFAAFSGACEKEDAYWFPAEAGLRGEFPASGVRLRRETGGGGETWRVTFKKQEKRGAIEVNDEREFEVSDGAVFGELLRRLGLVPKKAKCKRCRSWTFDGVTIELVFIEQLGWFVELEILAESDDAETISAAKAKLLALLGRMGVPETAIETRYYTAMLDEHLAREARVNAEGDAHE
jgi:adenylate cyclase class 2